MNRFKDTHMRMFYDEAVHMYRIKHRNLFQKDGSRCMGNSIASFFWRGFDGVNFGVGFNDAASRKMIGYAYWRAGQDIKKEILNSLIGKTVIITNKAHTDYQNWGIIKAYDGEYYHVAMNNDENACLVFARDEFKVKRKGYE